MPQRHARAAVKRDITTTAPRPPSRHLVKMGPFTGSSVSPTSEFAARLADIVQIAQAAGRCILGYRDRPQGPDAAAALLLPCKADESVLTLADVAAHEAIAGQLRDRWPGIAVVSEEDAASHAPGADGEYWLVDPLDGTKEFIGGSGEFTVNIALVRDGRPCLGVVVAPALDLAYWGGVGLGAHRAVAGLVRGIGVAAAGHTPQRVVASRSHMNAATGRFIEGLGPHALVQAGSSLKFCRVAEGSADIYPRLGPTCEWDTAAAQAIVEAAGGHVWTLDGAPLRYGKSGRRNPEFVASGRPASAILAGRASGDTSGVR